MNSQSTASNGTTGASAGLLSSRRYRLTVAWFLAIVYTFNFMDRQIVSVLQEPIRHELHLTDTQLGMLSGLTFALFYTVCGLPVAWLSDRFRRVWIMSGACIIWSVFTATCGMASSFAQLAGARIMVGVGEAGGSPPSYSLISDYFPPADRGVGLAIYSLGVPLGSAIGVAGGGWVAATFGWRAAFFAVGLPGIVLALAMLLVVREPRRGALDPALREPARLGGDSLGSAIREFCGDRTLVLTAVSSGLSAFVGYAMLSWNPSMLARAKGMMLSDIAAYYSIVLGVTGVIGTFGGGWLADRLAHRDRRWCAWIPALAFAITIPALGALLWAPTWQWALVFLAAPALLNNMYLAPALAVVQNATPAPRRAVAGAILLFVLNLVGLGGGPLYVGWISDLSSATYGNKSLLIGYGALIPVIALTIGAHLLAARTICKTGG